jgi:hypothetical protein
MKVRTNLTGGIIFIVFGTVLMLLLNTQVITYGQISFLQSAKVAPFFAEIIMVLGGIFLVIQSLVFKKESIIVIRWEEQKFAVLTILVFCIFAAAIYYTGFIIGSFLFIISMFVLNRNRSILEFVGLCALAVGIYFLFTSVFYVQLPGFGGVH